MIELLGNIWNEALEFLVRVLVPLGWPLVALTALVTFRKPLADLIGRLRWVSSKGARFSGDQGATGTTPKPELPEKSQPLYRELDPSIQYLYDDLSERLELGQYPNREEVLLDACAATIRASFSEYVLRFLFGSQFSFLIKLESKRDGIPFSGAEFYLNEHKSKATDRMFINVNEWAHFLVVNQLITLDPNQLQFKITKKGIAFVAYTRQNAISPSMLML
ncbi:MAG: hypothetical protein AAFX09_00860 [Pseudomonadota bacterium]